MITRSAVPIDTAATGGWDRLFQRSNKHDSNDRNGRGKEIDRHNPRIPYLFWLFRTDEHYSKLKGFCRSSDFPRTESISTYFRATSSR